MGNNKIPEYPRMLVCKVGVPVPPNGLIYTQKDIEYYAAYHRNYLVEGDELWYYPYGIPKDELNKK